MITDKEKIIEEYIIEEDKKLQNVYTMIEDSINSYELNFEDTIYVLTRLLHRTNKMLDTEE